MTDCHLPPRPQDLYTPSSDPSETGVHPQVVLGDPVTGVGGDSSRSAYQKYNLHDHARASSDLFTTTPALAGQLVQALDGAGAPIFPPGTALVQVTDERLFLDHPALQSAERFTLTLLEQGRQIHNCQAVKDSTAVSRRHTSGMLSGDSLERLASFVLNASWTRPAVGSHCVCLRLPAASRLREVWAETSSGSVRLSVQINQTVFGEADYLATTLSSGKVFSPSIVCPVGSSVRVVLSQPQNLEILDVSLLFSKIL